MSEPTASYDPSQPAPSRDLSEQFGPYCILQKLGAGGMGTVYRAHDTKLDRPVALKVPHFPPGCGPEVLRRFLREAHLAAKLHHPNICPVYDVGQIDGIDYLAMAFIPGKTLAQVISPERPMAPAQVASLVRTLALALHEAHAAGIIHRDLKPGNIMIDERNQPVIMDFGLAYSLQAEDSRLTQSGAVLGTPAYMSPEQIKADRQTMGPHSDVYSLGVILYQLLAGRLPFTGPVLAVLGQVLYQEPPPPAAVRVGVDPGLEAICRKAMAKKVEDRFASMAEFAEALKDWRRAGKRSLPPPLPDMRTSPVPDTIAPPEVTLQVPGRGHRGRRKAAWRFLLLWLVPAAVAVTVMFGIVAYLARDDKRAAPNIVVQNSAPNIVVQNSAPTPTKRAPDTSLVDGRHLDVPGQVEVRKQEAAKKHLPSLKNVDEMHIAFAAILADTYVFSSDYTRLFALRPTNNGDRLGRAGARAGDPFGRGGFNPGVMAGGGGGMGGRGPGGRPGGGNAGGFAGVPGKVQGPEEPANKRYDVVQVPLSDLGKKSDLIPARQLRSLRIAELVGAFPLRQQVEEFQRKMGLPRPEDVLGESVRLPNGRRVEAFRFLGVNMQRRTLDPAGQPVPGPEGQYQTLDLVGAYRPWLILCGKRFEPEDPEYEQLKWPGLVMPKLLQFRDNPGGLPGKNDLDNHYPPLEGKVQNLKETLEKLKAKMQTAEIAVPPQFNAEGWDPFNTAGTPEPQGNRPPAGRAGNPPGRAPGTPPPPGSQALIPEYCMVRVFDLNIEPGRTYQYRVQVRMANPLIGRTDVANPDWTKDEELKPEKATEWYELPETLTAPPEVDYYAVDQKDLERNYKGLNAYVTPSNNETTLQIHRWLDAVQIKGMGPEPLLIGEWAVADRVIVARGEYVDRTVHIELPVWSFTQNAFVIATDQTSRAKSQHGFDIPLSYNRPNKHETILIDFEGGRQDYKGSLKVDEDKFDEKSVRDTSATDILLMDPEGRLLGHNTAVDSVDPERKHRREQVQARVERVKQTTAGQGGRKPGDKNPFGPGS
jgi:hypothetical protein